MFYRILAQCKLSYYALVTCGLVYKCERLSALFHPAIPATATSDRFRKYLVCQVMRVIEVAGDFAAVSGSHLVCQLPRMLTGMERQQSR